MLCLRYRRARGTCSSSCRTQLKPIVPTTPITSIVLLGRGLSYCVSCTRSAHSYIHSLAISSLVVYLLSAVHAPSPLHQDPGRCATLFEPPGLTKGSPNLHKPLPLFSLFLLLLPLILLPLATSSPSLTLSSIRTRSIPSQAEIDSCLSRSDCRPTPLHARTDRHTDRHDTRPPSQRSFTQFQAYGWYGILVINPTTLDVNHRHLKLSLPFGWTISLHNPPTHRPHIAHTQCSGHGESRRTTSGRIRNGISLYVVTVLTRTEPL